MTIYDLALKGRWGNILKYPLAVIFLIDFYLTWKRHDRQLRGDTVSNISLGLASLLRIVERLLRALGRR